MSVIAAKRLKIPIFHMEAGNRCNDMRVPEEINRKVLDHLSDVNLTVSEQAGAILSLKEFHLLWFKTGSHMQEVLQHHRDDIVNSKVLNTLKLQEQKYFLVSLHREENVDDPSKLSQLVSSLNAVATHLNSLSFSLVILEPLTVFPPFPPSAFHPLVRVLKPLGFLDYCCLQLNAHCVLSDNGTILIILLSFPASLCALPMSATKL